MSDKSKTYFPCIWQAILLTIGYLGVSIVLSIVVTIPGLIIDKVAGMPRAGHIFIYSGLSVLMILASFATLYLVSRLTKMGFSSCFQRPSVLTWPLVLGLTLSLIGGTIVFQFVNFLLDSILPMPQFFQTMLLEVFKEPVSAFMAVCIMAPFAEEFIFRGVLVRGLRSHYSMRKTLIWTGILFALVHLNPYQYVVGFFMGAALAYIYIRTQSLWLVIGCHFLNNFISWGAAYNYLGIEIQGYTGLAETGAMPPWFVALGIVLMISGWVLAVKELRKGPYEFEDQATTDTISVAATPLPADRSPEPPPLPELNLKQG